MDRPSRSSRSCRCAGRFVVATSALALVASGCSTGTEPEPNVAASVETVSDVEPVTVVATTSILGDVVEQLVGEDGTVTVLMGPGVDPHGYAPSARDAATMREADLVVANGLQLEESLVSTLEATEVEGVPVFELAPQLDPLE
ncbi:MAG: zinc ABC transporter substrate-binding protein, partial [Nitriliruptor sp.]